MQSILILLVLLSVGVIILILRGDWTRITSATTAITTRLRTHWRSLTAALTVLVLAGFVASISRSLESENGLSTFGMVSIIFLTAVVLFGIWKAGWVSRSAIPGSLRGWRVPSFADLPWTVIGWLVGIWMVHTMFIDLEGRRSNFYREARVPESQVCEHLTATDQWSSKIPIKLRPFRLEQEKGKCIFVAQNGDKERAQYYCGGVLKLHGTNTLQVKSARKGDDVQVTWCLK